MKEAPRPEGLVEGNRYDTSVAAEIITAKYGYHLPIYRQQDHFAGSGWTPSRSTLLNILVASAACIRPFVLYLREEVIQSGLLGTDETRDHVACCRRRFPRGDSPATPSRSGSTRSSRKRGPKGGPASRGGCGLTAA